MKPIHCDGIFIWPEEAARRAGYMVSSLAHLSTARIQGLRPVWPRCVLGDDRPRGEDHKAAHLLPGSNQKGSLYFTKK